ncbi:MAG: hypothetical protein CM1200mP26_30670 [Acidimicrobiales bacterium]|nr:MAG: hypothetical protein CM1200mP26_30670 [Acidimicrobiales bacterium]
MISWVSANHDPEVFEQADEVVIDRSINRHLAFGLGGHRCIGAQVARMEAEVMFRDVLNRIPDYVIDEDLFRPYPGNLPFDRCGLHAGGLHCGLETGWSQPLGWLRGVQVDASDRNLDSAVPVVEFLGSVHRLDEGRAKCRSRSAGRSSNQPIKSPVGN